MKAVIIIAMAVLFGCGELTPPTTEEPFSVTVRYVDGTVDTVYNIDRMNISDGGGVKHFIFWCDNAIVGEVMIEGVANPPVSVIPMKKVKK